MNVETIDFLSKNHTFNVIDYIRVKHSNDIIVMKMYLNDKGEKNPCHHYWIVDCCNCNCDVSSIINNEKWKNHKVEVCDEGDDYIEFSISDFETIVIYNESDIAYNECYNEIIPPLNVLNDFECYAFKMFGFMKNKIHYILPEITLLEKDNLKDQVTNYLKDFYCNKDQKIYEADDYIECNDIPENCSYVIYTSLPINIYECLKEDDDN